MDIQVSPAPAGMIPTNGRLMLNLKREPRTRGDDPWLECSIKQMGM